MVTKLLKSLIRHANNLSKALDARHYVAGASRTRWHQPTFSTREAIALGITACFIALVFVLA